MSEEGEGGTSSHTTWTGGEAWIHLLPEPDVLLPFQTLTR